MGGATPAREYLDQAKAAAVQIPLPGDQSAAFREIALTLASSDPATALDLAARMRRPSDAARALGAAAVELAGTDPASAMQDVVTAGRLILRITDPDQRLAEQQLLLREIAPLGEGALPVGPELTTGQAQFEIVQARAESDPDAALALLRKWQLRDAAYDLAAAAIADHLAVANPEEAIDLASSIASARERDRAFWRIAEQRPAEEAEGIAARVSDPVTKSGILRSAALRLAPRDLDAAVRIAGLVPVASGSAKAEVAVALAPTDQAKALQMAGELPALGRSWALERISVSLASSKPQFAEQLLREASAGADAVSLVAASMARSGPDRATALALSLPSGEQRDAALASMVRALATTDPARAKGLLWEMGSSRWRAVAVSAVAVSLARDDVDEATGLIGLVADPRQAADIRARIAAVIAGRDPALAGRLLDSLPPSEAKTTAALEAAAAVLASGGQQDVAIRLGSLAVERDLAIRWMAPGLAYAQTRSPVGLSGGIGSTYLRSLALVDVARAELGLVSSGRPAPSRAAQIRPIVEWEQTAGNREPRAEPALESGLPNPEPRTSVHLDLQLSTPSVLVVRIDGATSDRLYRVTYDDGKHRFVWENLSPDASGTVTLTDDRHLRPEYRMMCESRTGAGDPVVFDDLLKGAVAGQRRLPFGVPVSAFGGPGYLVPGVSDLKRDDFGNFWLCLQHEPYAILKYGPDFSYRFALLLPDAPVAHDTDAEGNLYLLHQGNWISKHGPLGENLGAWELPTGRGPGEFVTASGMAVDRAGGALYLADEVLGRVQRFGLDLRLRPLPFTPWGWLGRGEMTYTKPGEYDRDQMYYQLDRPRQLLLDGDGNLLVSCEHYVSKFDLGTGKQTPFGRSPVLGWGVTFTDSPFSPSAGLDGHWQRHWLSGVDAAGNVYISDRGNEYVVDSRLQLFGPDGVFLRGYNIETDVRDAQGRRVYLAAVKGLVATPDAIYLADAAGRIYRSPSPNGLVSGGALHLGPGAAGRQFDLSQVDGSKLSVEAQSGRIRRRYQGKLLSFPGARLETGNCEREGSASLGDGERSLWTPSRMGEPFGVTLFDATGAAIPASDCAVEYEERPGLFGSRYDFFRVTNRSGRSWQGVTFVADALD